MGHRLSLSLRLSSDLRLVNVSETHFLLVVQPENNSWEVKSERLRLQGHCGICSETLCPPPHYHPLP